MTNINQTNPQAQIPEAGQVVHSYLTQAKETFCLAKQKFQQSNRKAQIATVLAGSTLALATLAGLYSYLSVPLNTLGSLESLRKEYGEGRTFSLLQAYETKQEIVNSIPQRLNKFFFSFYNKEDARLAYEFTQTAHTYSQERTWWIVQQGSHLLNFLKKTTSSFEDYYLEMKQNPNRAIQELLKESYSHNTLVNSEYALNGLSVSALVASGLGVAYSGYIAAIVCLFSSLA